MVRLGAQGGITAQHGTAHPWGAAVARHFASQLGETYLPPAGAACPLATPIHCFIWGLFGFCGFWSRQCKGLAVLSSLPNLPPAMAISASVHHSRARRLASTRNAAGSTRSMGCLCYAPALTPKKRGRAAGGRELPAHHSLRLVTCQPPFPICKHSSGYFLNMSQYEVFS